jgi:hypothetical protein
MRPRPVLVGEATVFTVSPKRFVYERIRSVPGSDSRPVPIHTEKKIVDLCTSALKAKGKELESILADLRFAIDEHVSLAREALGAQAANIAMRDSAASESSGPQESL